MIPLLLALSAHADPPTRALLDDIDRWEAGQQALLAGPAGCWDMEGDVRQVLTLHQPPDLWSAGREREFAMVGTVTGRLVDGQWTDELEDALKPVDHELDLDVGVTPLFGKLPPDEKEEKEELVISVNGKDSSVQVNESIGSSVNALTSAIEELSGSVETSLAQWDAEQKAVLYLRELPLADNDNRVIKVTVRFPEAGEVADRIDAVWPSLIKVGDWPLRVKIRDAQMHAVGHPHGDQVMPWAESLSLVVGALGFTAGFEQQVTWRTATPCVSDGTSEPSGEDEAG